jgi:hypothetical protein
MDSRVGRWSIILLASALVWATLVGAGAVRAANAPPLATAWNIASTGKAATSGELVFRVTAEEGTDPVEVTVFVLSGSNETGVASSIRRALSTQLDARKFNVAGGEGANVLVTNASGSSRFFVELVDSDVENVSVRVQNATPAASPTVPAQQAPAVPSNPPATPPQPGNALPPPAESAPPAPTPEPGPGPNTTPAIPSIPSTPPISTPAPPTSPSTPPTGSAGGEAGAGVSAPPPGGVR